MVRPRMPLFQSTSFEDEMMPQETVQPEEDEPIVEETRDDIPKAGYSASFVSAFRDFFRAAFSDDYQNVRFDCPS